MTNLIISFILTHGAFLGSFNWTTNGSGDDALGGQVQFTAKTCKNYDIIQAARLTNDNKTDFIWTGSDAPRNQMKSKNKFFIDHKTSGCVKGKSCSPYFGDHWKTGHQKGHKQSPARIEDYPYGWVYFEKIELESCVKCLDNGKFIGCMKWGGVFPVYGDKFILNPSSSNAPSKDFNEALSRFTRYYK